MLLATSAICAERVLCSILQTWRLADVMVFADAMAQAR
jgi:hypothetical protein